MIHTWGPRFCKAFICVLFFLAGFQNPAEAMGSLTLNYDRDVNHYFVGEPSPARYVQHTHGNASTPAKARLFVMYGGQMVVTDRVFTADGTSFGGHTTTILPTRSKMIITVYLHHTNGAYCGKAQTEFDLDWGDNKWEYHCGDAKFKINFFNDKNQLNRDSHKIKVKTW